MTTDSPPPNYVQSHLPPLIVEKLEAGAFRSLRTHLEERSDEVQNIDLMTISGFCRNCLAKWMVVEARKLVENFPEEAGNNEDQKDTIINALNALGYDEAAQYVYRMDYKDWKKRHAKKASDEQMQEYNDSKPLHSQFDKELLAVKGDKPKEQLYQQTVPSPSDATVKPPLLSNVCCQDIDDAIITKDEKTEVKPTPAPGTITNQKAKNARAVGPYIPPALPTKLKELKIQIITVSDRAFRNEYKTGDLSGPAVRKSVEHLFESAAQKILLAVSDIVVVPDEIEEIQSKLRHFADIGVDLVLTTGGTGFAPRDVTPEATRGVVDRECPGLMQWVLNETSRDQPLASLSRGTSGILGSTIIANLPGNPKGVEEIVPLLLPLLLYAVNDMQEEQ
mmetsp:Transcript_23281/g.33367  ORF Transcript_23281/g.33367 Transcript_23281/m.33367 type:complete len:392 (-) Transcript_23281:1455-2630(-)